MLIIRKEQMETFSQQRFEKFENEMVDFVQKIYPYHYQILGESPIRLLIQYGIERAEHYGLTTERDACRYISLMLVFGSDFDQDPQYPWAQRILNDESIPGSDTRSRLLYDEELFYLEEVFGADGTIFINVLKKLRQDSLDNWSLYSYDNFEKDMLSKLNQIYPQKYENTAENSLCQLVKRGMSDSDQYGIGKPGYKSLYVSFMFLLGSGFNKDLQYPWASRVLNNQALANEDEKVTQLYTEAMDYLDNWLDVIDN